MDNDAILKQFEEIEQKVDKLIGVCKSFEETKLELTNKIEGLEKELQGKAEEESRYAEEKALIRSKVDSLLARLEDVTEG
ncbi:MAG: hypothetical protein H8E17_07475 [Deltaproteobacteria bacterium]|nr:hypothetical protein [Deltaproteobacteria bacterium]